MAQTLRADQMMTAEVHTLNPMMTIRAAMELLTEHRISGAPVVDTKNVVITVVSEGDLLKLAASYGMEVTINNCLSKLCKMENLVTAKKAASFQDIYRLFMGRPVHRIPVVDDNGKLQGIISRSNVLRALIEASRSSEKEKAAEKTEKPTGT